MLLLQRELQELDAAMAGNNISRLNVAVQAVNVWISANTAYPAVYELVAQVSAPSTLSSFSFFTIVWC